jgi:polysaccharide deacetylase family protein (PEP-CTERM system associated)
VFTVDVEDWFQVNAFEPYVSRDRWSSYESRVERNTDRLLQLCADTGTIGTFFTLGWVAERCPHLVRRIADAGHEVASHGYWHQRIPTISEAEFRADVRRARDVLQDTAGVPVSGYRAPSFSLTDGVPWAARVLVEEGYRYDSSRFPISRRGYGSGLAPRHPHVLGTPSGPLHEYPPAVWPLAGMSVPVAGGGWFRQFPEWVAPAGLAQVLRMGQPAVFYLHPWEVDPEQPRLSVGALTRVRHYRGLAQCAGRLERLLKRFRFTSFANIGTAVPHSSAS